MENLNSKLLIQYNDLIWANLNSLNSKRAKNLSILCSIITFLIFFIDLYYRSSGLWNSNHGYVLLFYSHVIMFLTLLLFVLVYHINRRNHSPFFYKYYTLAFSLFLLDIGAYTSGWVDQMIHGEITVYTMGCFIIAVLLYLKPKYVILLYAQSFLLFALLLNTIQKNNSIRYGDDVNSLVIILVACYISFSISKLMQRQYGHKYKLEELVKERSDALIVQQQAINRLQQLNLVAEMSANIAHEVRNPMTTVRGFLQLLGGREYNEKDKYFFELMISELDRANVIITEFLLFSKEKKYLLKKQNLNTIITKLIPLLDIDTKYNLVSDLGEIPELLLDEKQICQLILNFTNNGYESMPSGGRLVIKTYQSNEKVIFEVQDEGKGIDPEILDKIGTPFFTTKEQGTGLGLGVCRNIIDQHHAQFEIESSPKGSNFRVIFKIAS